MKIPKLLQLANTYKPMNSFCKMFGQFCKQNWKTLATVSPASVSSPELTASIVSWTASAMKTCTSSNKTARRSKTTNAFKFKWLANLCPSHFLDLYSVSKLTAIEVASRVPLWLSFCLSGGSFLGRPRWSQPLQPSAGIGWHLTFEVALEKTKLGEPRSRIQTSAMSDSSRSPSPFCSIIVPSIGRQSKF